MAQIRFLTPQRKIDEGKEGGGGMGEKAGAVIGGIAGAVGGGGPAGAIGGASAGAGLGRRIGEAIDPAQQLKVVEPVVTAGIPTSNALDRRLAEIEQSPHFGLQRAQAALSQLPKNIQQEYGPTIEMALEASRKAQRVGSV